MPDSEWKYYLPDIKETETDAEPVPICEWLDIHDAEDAAERAADDEWSNRDGWESGPESSFIVAIISPEGKETKFEVSHETEIVHCVREINESN